MGEAAAEEQPPSPGSSSGGAPAAAAGGTSPMLVGSGDQAPRPSRLVGLPIKWRPLFPTTAYTYTITNPEVLTAVAKSSRVRLPRARYGCLLVAWSPYVDWLAVLLRCCLTVVCTAVSFGASLCRYTASQLSCIQQYVLVESPNVHHDVSACWVDRKLAVSGCDVALDAARGGLFGFPVF